jgi:hypothetical protein
MIRSLIIRTDFGVVRLLQRIVGGSDTASLANEDNITSVDSSYPLNILSPVYIGIAGILVACHFIPFPQPWGFATYIAVCYFLGLSVIHALSSLSRTLRLSMVSPQAPSNLGDLVLVGTWITCLVTLSFIAPSPLNFLYQ